MSGHKSRDGRNVEGMVSSFSVAVPNLKKSSGNAKIGWLACYVVFLEEVAGSVRAPLFTVATALRDRHVSSARGTLQYLPPDALGAEGTARRFGKACFLYLRSVPQ